MVVMGDLDRSPRMTNHAFSALESNMFSHVDLIGYRGTGLPSQLSRYEESGELRVRYISTLIVDLLKKLPRFLYLVYAVLRIII